MTVHPALKIGSTVSAPYLKPDPARPGEYLVSTMRDAKVTAFSPGYERSEPNAITMHVEFADGHCAQLGYAIWAQYYAHTIRNPEDATDHGR